MDFLSRLIGNTLPPKKPAAKPTANDPQVRLARFKRVYHTVLELCNRPRNLATEGPLLIQLNTCLERIAVLLREETRAPVPHTCLQFSKGQQIFAVIARAATVSQDEPVIRSAIAVFAALIDSEEEDFLSSSQFAKSLMRLVRKVLESGNVLVDTETETVILELLFTISAKIRLQPEILPVWFQSTAKPPAEEVFNDEKKGNFVGTAQHEDFPLCYLLIDRVHHEGRIGDFARTGLLYVFEATGRSVELEEWVVSSDLPTLMASGLGALYSQLSRELSILHLDATLPPVLAMSDYTTTHPRATAESAFSDRHKAHISTFLSHLAFWQDVLDHCKSDDVKQTLLDHFKILFLEQLLYPSLLQSSDTDAGSSIAVLTYMTSILEALEYPDLINMILNYLLAIQETSRAAESDDHGKESAPPSPTAVKRRQSLMKLNSRKDADDAVDPNLFNLVDLIINNVTSRNSQSVYSALKLSATILARQKKYALGTLLKVQSHKVSRNGRTIGGLEKEVKEYSQLVSAVHQEPGLEHAYQSLCEDVRHTIEAQLLLKQSTGASKDVEDSSPGRYTLLVHDAFIRAIRVLLRSFLTNSVDVNLALSQALISIALCQEVCLDGWLALNPSTYSFSDEGSSPSRSWQSHLDNEELAAWDHLKHATRSPSWSSTSEPLLYQDLKLVALELETVRDKVPNLGQLITSRKKLLQGGTIDSFPNDLPSTTNSPTQRTSHLDVPNVSRGSRRSIRGPESTKAKKERATSGSSAAASPMAASRATSTSREQSNRTRTPSPSAQSSIFKPPPPETPSTTDVLMQTFEFPNASGGDTDESASLRTASLNHILSNIVVLQEFMLELVAVLQVRAAVLGEAELLNV